MNLVCLDIPDDPADWPNWLERQLVGLDLGDLVVQLEMFVDRPAEPKPKLDDVCGPAMDDVLRSGLSPLSDEQIRTLLKHPRLLLELQQRVLIEGGEYWSSVPITEEHQRRVADGKGQILARIEAELPHEVPPQPSSSSGSSRGRIALLPLVAIAAMLLIAVSLWLSRPAGPTWGFDRGGLLTADIPPDEYLQALAEAAGDWFNKRPETQADLAQRLREFSHGCETLINAPHPQLSPDDREWLIDRCRAWQEKIENHLAELETGVKQLRQVRDEADATVEQLMEALQSRASEAA